MRKTTRLKKLIQAPEILVMPGAFDPLSAKLAERAGFHALQCTGLGISAVHVGRPDYSFISMNEMTTFTRLIVEATSLPVMGDGDTGFGNAVNAYFTVQAFERAGAAGVNLEDQVMPKRCGHLEGKSIVDFEEAVTKIRAASDARTDPDFVINARTDALAVSGMDEVIRRGNAYLEAGATMIFIDGITSREEISAAVRGINGPVAINLVEGGKSPKVTFAELEKIGVARVSLPGTLLRGAMKGMEDALSRVKAANGLAAAENARDRFQESQGLFGMTEVYALERKYFGNLNESASNVSKGS